MLSDAGTAYDRFVEVNLTVSDLNVEFAVGICANPRFVVNSGSLRPKVGQRDQTSLITAHTLGPVARIQICHSPPFEPKIIIYLRIGDTLEIRDSSFASARLFPNESILDHAEKYS